MVGWVSSEHWNCIKRETLWWVLGALQEKIPTPNSVKCNKTLVAPSHLLWFHTYKTTITYSLSSFSLYKSPDVPCQAIPVGVLAILSLTGHASCLMWASEVFHHLFLESSPSGFVSGQLPLTPMSVRRLMKFLNQGWCISQPDCRNKMPHSGRLK